MNRALGTRRLFPSEEDTPQHLELGLSKEKGIKILKNILKENEKEFNGNLPMYRKERKTSVAFHVFTNQIVVVEIKNHKL